MPGGTTELVALHARLQALTRARHFRELDGGAARALIRTATIVEAPAGRVLWRAGDPGTAAMQILDGAVMILAPRRNGDEVALGVFGPGECIGLAAALGRTPYPASPVTLTPVTRLLAIPTPTLHEAMQEFPACERAARAALLDHGASLRLQVDVLAAGSVPARLATFLLYLGEKFGVPTPSGAVHISLQVSRTLLAHAIATRPETVIRCLAAWKRQRVVFASRAGIELRAPGRLHELTLGA